MLNPWETVLTGNVDDGTVFDAPFTETLDGWYITSNAYPGYPTVVEGMGVDVRFASSGGYFTHAAFDVEGSTGYRLHMECQLIPPETYMNLHTVIRFSDGSTVEDFANGLSSLFFTFHEFEFTTPAGCEGLQVMFDSVPSRYYLRNCSLTKD